jgi:AraC-like DNA-binding protein
MDVRNRINHLDWQSALKDHENVYSIGKDFFLMDNIIHTGSIYNHPFIVDSVNAVICLKGITRGKINLKSYETKAPCMVIILPEQILEYEYISDDFEGLSIIMSKRFTESLNIEESFSTFVSVRDNPCIPLNENELKAMRGYYSMMKNTIEAKENPFRLEIAKHLTKAFFYGAGYYFHKLKNDTTKNKNEQLAENFIRFVQANFKEERGVEFYAEKLCLNAKYMSTIIKQTSGKSAGEWIDDRVMLEVKALLKSTNMTIQQIADELNFPTQSSFGKYFKRLAGVSPKEYRNNTNTYPI